MPLKPESDDDLIVRVANGDKTAMRVIYESHAGALENFVKNWLADPSQASDLVHETMLEVWKKASRFEGRSSLKSWIFAIARNKSIDSNRRNSRIYYTDEIPEIVDDHPGAEDMLFASENAKALSRAMSELSENHRRVLHLAYFEDMKYEEIAHIENCPIGTVKTRIMHGKKKLLHIVKKNAQ